MSRGLKKQLESPQCIEEEKATAVRRNEGSLGKRAFSDFINKENLNGIHDDKEEYDDGSSES